MADAGPLLILLLALVVFWALVMRPARNQQRRTQQLQAGLEVGDEVVLTSGIFGTIHGLEEHRVRLEVAPSTVLSVARQAVVRRVEPEATADPGTTPGEGTDDPADPRND